MAALLAEQAAAQLDPVPLAPETLDAARVEFLRRSRRWNALMPDGVTVRDTALAIGDRRIGLKILQPGNPLPGSLVYVHGGGFVFGSPASHARITALLAAGTGLTTISVDYRLAPEHPFPHGLNDVIAVLDNLETLRHDHGFDAGPCLMAGDSAGATLVLSSLLAKPELAASVRGAVLFYGAFGTDFDTPSYRSFAEGYGLTRQRMMDFWSVYLAGADGAAQGRAVPLQAQDAGLSALPPLQLLGAGADVLLSDSVLMHRRLCDLGRDDQLIIEPGCTHGFVQMSSEFPRAAQALGHAAEWLSARAVG